MRRTSLCVLLLLLSSAAWAEGEEDDEFDFLKAGDTAAKKKEPGAGDFSAYDAEDDSDLADFKLAPPEEEVKPKAPPPEAKPPVKALPYSVEGKKPLGDNYPAQVVATAADSVVIELPVLLALKPGDLTTEYWLVAEVWSDGKRLTESRQRISASSAAQTGATFAFIKVLVPVSGATGALELRVGQATSATAAPKALFTRKVEYQLGS